MNRVVVFMFVVACRFLTSESRVDKLTNNGYTGVLIAIEPGVPENPAMIDAIKKMMTEASKYLFTATLQRAYFKEVRILVPKNWSGAGYVRAEKEDYESADIRIASPNPNLKNNPYTQGYNSCGRRGLYIHLTPDYMTMNNVAKNYGPRDRVVVHEWGHYKWGLLDEYPLSQEQKFYISKNQVEATRCSAKITGAMKDPRTGKSCVINKKTKLPEAHCYFYDDTTQPAGVRTSIMYKQFISSVATFCHSNKSDPKNLHNIEAKNNQNKYCDHQSTWDVIMKSDDFQNGKVNGPNPKIINTTPEFKIVQVQPKQIVLVMDVSGSMEGPKLDKLRAAAVHLIMNILTDDTYVALVSFDSVSSVLANSTQLKSKTVKESLISSLPSVADGATAVGLGIQTGVKALQFGGRSQEGGKIIVLTDGEENTEPFVTDIANETVNDNVIVHAIFIGVKDVDEHAPLVKLCERTSGTWSYVDDVVRTGSQLHHIFASLAQDADGDLSNDHIQISNQEVTSTSSSLFQLSTAIDGSVGKETTFTFTWSEAEPTIVIKPPSKNCIFSNTLDQTAMSYCAENPIDQVYTSFKTLIFNIPGTAEIGQWKYNISVNTADTVTATVVSSSSGEDPITVKPRLTSTSVNEGEATIVVAEVFQNHLPVLGANVTAKVLQPDGSDFEMTLVDNGAGADVRPNDGFYSKYFSAFTARGRYFVEVSVSKNDDGTDDSSASSIAGAPNNDPGDGIIRSEIIGANIKGDVERVASSSGLQYTGTISARDIFPPNKITDLSVSQVNLNNASEGIILEFTAPGDDFDDGKASSYEIRYTYDNITSLLEDFSEQLNVGENSVTSGSLRYPKPAFTKETFILTLTDIPDDEDSVIIVFAVRAYDEVNNPSKISNIVVTRFFIKPPQISIDEEEPKDNRILIYSVAGGGGALLLLIIVGVTICCCKRKK